MASNGGKKVKVDNPLPTKEEMIADIQKVFESYYEIHKDDEKILPLPRDFYRARGQYTDHQISKVFNDFPSFRKTIDMSHLKELNQEKELIRLRNEIDTLKKDKKALMKTSIDEDRILDIYTSDILPFKAPEKLKLTKVIKDDKKVAILNLSDFHCGEVVDPKEVQYVNEYNIEIMKQRVDRVIYYCLYYCKKFGIKELWILFLGDLFSGSIHPELIRTNEDNDVACLFILQDYIAKKLVEIEPYFASINCEFLVGNHSRLQTEGKPQMKTQAMLNWEYILAKQLQLQFDLLQLKKEKKIFIGVNDSLFKVVEIAKRKFFITHGTFMTGGGSGGFAGIPYYALSMNSSKMSGVLNQIDIGDASKFDDIIMGHLHSTSRVGMSNGGNLYVNGCIIGTNEFSLQKIKSVAKIEQSLLIVHDGYVINEITLRGK